jgi:endonuclease G
MSTLASGRITVPANTWKVVVVLPAGGGIGGINNNTRVIAVNMPNSQGIRTTDWRSFRTSVDQIEATTGYNFLSNVSEALQETLESKVDTQ